MNNTIVVDRKYSRLYTEKHTVVCVFYVSCGWLNLKKWLARGRNLIVFAIKFYSKIKEVFLLICSFIVLKQCHIVGILADQLVVTPTCSPFYNRIN